LQQIGNRDSNDWIRMNPRQFQTDIGKCKGSVCTYSEKVEILNILDKVVESFRKTEIDETANWKTYQNEDFGVKFSYPKDWYFSPPKDWYVYFGEPEGKILLGKELAVSPYTGERDPLYKIFKIISANPTEIALKFLKGKYNSSYYTLELQEKFNFQKKQAQKVLITCTSEYYTEQEIGAKEEMIIVVLDDYTSFIIPLSNRSPEYAYPFTKEQSDIINQILSTFKFVEKEEN
ncbi:hypothetical protein KKG29_03475, partial [Patescibacteria group bacterium]|nr:hypothetical protein [Patescibacteria group bacterium]